MFGSNACVTFSQRGYEVINPYKKLEYITLQNKNDKKIFNIFYSTKQCIQIYRKIYHNCYA